MWSFATTDWLDGEDQVETSKGLTESVRPLECIRPGRSPDLFSAPEGIRTPNLLIRNQMLYPLSYGR